jgi:hypothetical protein
MRSKAIFLSGAVLSLLLTTTTVEGQTSRDRVDTSYGCVSCHSENRTDFVQGIHSEYGMKCDDCHGGDPESFELPQAHSGRFLGSPDKLETVTLCASCHSDADEMRQYGLPSGQLAEFRTSRHGQALLGERNFDAPTCTDCHDAHLIRRETDARSNVFPIQIAETCRQCHEDETLMEKYDLPTNQHADFVAGAHGRALYEDENLASPSCIGCHGSHAALPARPREVVNVCAGCHELVGRAFIEGPHGSATDTGEMSACLSCHVSHDSEAIPSAAIGGLCAACHEDGTPANQVGREIEGMLVAAEEDLHAADGAIAELVVAGQNTADALFRYQTAVTYYEQMRMELHGMDVDALEELTRRVDSNAREVLTTAEIRAERRWEHKLMLLPIWFFALSGIALALFKLRESR